MPGFTFVTEAVMMQLTRHRTSESKGTRIGYYGFDKSVVIIRPQTYFFMAKAKPNAKTSAQPKIGRPLTYTPEQLASKFEEYAVWVKENPRINYKILSDGSEVPVRIERPFTLSGFTIFANIHPDTFRNFEKREEFFDVCACIRARIETD